MNGSSGLWRYAVLGVIGICFFSRPAFAQRAITDGTACVTGDADFWDQSYVCDSSAIWRHPAFQFGTNGASCATGTAGMVQWTGTALQYCDGTKWDTLGGAGSSTIDLGTELSALNPQRSGEATTGLYSAGSGLIDMAVNESGTATQVGEWSSSGLNLTGASEALDVNSVSALKLSSGGNPIIGNIALGPTTAPNSLAIGYHAMNAATEELDSVAVGQNALASHTSGETENTDGSTAVGIGALQRDTTGHGNDAFGYEALNVNTTGFYNAAFGEDALSSNVTGQNNAAFGEFALEANTTGGGNTALGYSALGANTTGNENVAIGNQVLDSNTTGIENIAIGDFALSDSNGGDNVALGANVLDSNTSGNSNIAIGPYSMGANTTGSDNVSVGWETLPDSTGDNNVAIGFEVASTTLATGSNDILIGSDTTTDTPTSSTSNWLNIGNAIYGYNLYNSYNSGPAQIAIGTNLTSVTAGAVLDLSSNTNSLLLPVGTSGQRPTGVNGMLRYNTTTNSAEGFINGAWTSLSGGSGSNASLGTPTSETIGTVYAASTPGIVTAYAPKSSTCTLEGLADTNPTPTTVIIKTETPNETGAVASITFPVASGDNYEVTETDCTTPNAMLWTPLTGGGGSGGSGGTVDLGTGLSALNPQAASDSKTGLYSAGTGLIDMAVNESGTTTQVGEWSSGGLNLTGASEALNIDGSNAIWFPTDEGGIGSSIAIGPKALSGQTTTGYYSNVAIGYYAMGLGAITPNGNAPGNTAVGDYAMADYTNGEYNTAVGSGAMTATTTGSGNTAIGSDALSANTTGSNQTAIGNGALSASTASEGNIAIGYNALGADTTGVENVAMNGLQVNTTGSDNTAIGMSSLYQNTTGAGNTVLGAYALFNNTMGNDNTALGYGGGGDLTSGGDNTILGFEVASTTLSTGSDNILIGVDNTTDTATAATNTAIVIGQYAKAGFTDIAIGYYALGNTNQDDNTNTAVGWVAMGGTTTGENSAAFGAFALQNNASGAYNLAVGYGALLTNTSGGDNTAIGSVAMYNSTTAAYDTALGVGAGSSITSGDANVAVGDNVASTTLTTGNYDILIGTDQTTDVPTASTSSWMNIGNAIYGYNLYNASNPSGVAQIAIGTNLTSITAGAVLDLSSNTNSMLLPIGTTGKRPGTGVNGMIRYSSTLNLLEGYIGGKWAHVLSGSDGTPTCGTGCSSVTSGSTDAVGTLTTGTSVTSAILDFSATLPAAPRACLCNVAGAYCSAAETTSAVTLSFGSSVSSAKATWICAQ